MSDNSFIYKPESRYTADSADASSEDNYYTLAGLEDFIDTEGNPRVQSDSDSVFAKKIIRKDNTIKYIVRLNTSGKFYNPVSIYGQEHPKSFLDRVCRSNNKHKEVSQKVFEWYVKFLSTKNTAWLSNAEREDE
jgi:hypothetical protein